MADSTDRIERQILINVPRSRVWRALTDAEEFGGWFGRMNSGGWDQQMKNIARHVAPQ
jgi:uncharacterized protein YndB with AHSA1/START domain